MKTNKIVKLGKLKNLKLATDYVRDLLVAGPEGAVGKGVELGMGAFFAKSVMRRLPVPFNFIVPFVAEKIIMKHGAEEGRDILLKGLKWIKKVTDEKPEAEIARNLNIAQI